MTNTVHVGSTAFLDALHNVAPCRDKNNARHLASPALATVHLVSDGTELTLTATDRYTMATQTVGAKNDGEAWQTNIPNRTVTELLKLKLGPDEILTISLDDQTIKLMWQNRTIITQAKAAEYPRTEQFFQAPAAPVGTIGLDAKLLTHFEKLRVGGKPSTTVNVFTFRGDRKPVALTSHAVPGWKGLIVPVRLP